VRRATPLSLSIISSGMPAASESPDPSLLPSASGPSL
jgi:hypothetical protein